MLLVIEKFINYGGVKTLKLTPSGCKGNNLQLGGATGLLGWPIRTPVADELPVIALKYRM